MSSTRGGTAQRDGTDGLPSASVAEEQARFALEAAGLGTWRRDLATGAVVWSPQLEALHGLAPGTFAGTYEAYQALIHPDDRERVAGTAAQSIAAGADHRVEYRAVWPDGTVRWLAGWGRVLYDGKEGEPGEPTGLVGVAIDVTDRHRAEEELRRSRNQLEIILEGVADGITLQSPTGELLYANDAAARIIGYPSAAELLAAPLSEVMRRFAVMDEHGEPLPLDRLPGRRALVGEHPPETLLRFRVLATGEERWSVVTATPVLDDRGSVQFVVNVFRDVTEQHRAEQTLRDSEARYRLLFESNPHPMWVFDLATLRFLAVNDAAVEQYGYSHEEFLGLTLLDVRPPEDAPAILDKVARVTADPEGLDVAGVWRHRRKDGSVFHAEVTTHALVWDGRPARLSLAIDITERRRSEAALRDSEERFRQLAEHVNAAFWITELPERRVLYMSPAYERLWGLDQRRLYEDRRAWLEAIHPDDQERAEAAFQAAFFGQATVERFEEEYRISLPDGSVRWVRDRAFPIRNEAGEVYRVAGITEDVTDGKQAEVALRESEERYRSLVAATTSVVWSTNAEGRFAVPQPSWEAYTGQRWPEHAGWGWAEMLHPDDRERVKALWTRALTERAPYASAGRVWHAASGQYRYFEARATPLLAADGSLREWVGTITDVDDRKRSERALRESEERFRATFEQAAVGMALKALDGRWLRVNQRLCDLLGYTREELLARSFQDVTHPDDLDADLDYFRRLLAGEIDTYSLEKRYVRKDGSAVWANRTVSLVRDSAGEPDYAIAIIEDISLRKEVEAEREWLLARVAAERAQLEAVLQQLPVGVIIAEAPSGKIILGNAQIEAIGGRPFDADDGVEDDGRYTAFYPDGRPYPLEEYPLTRAIRSGEVVAGEELGIRRGDDTTATLRVNAAPIRDRDGRIVAAVATFDDVTERKRVEDAQRFLAEESELLTASLDDETTLARLAHLTVPRLADLCIVDLCEEDGSIRRLVAAHQNPALEEMLREFDRRHPLAPDGPHPLMRAIRTGKTEFLPEVSDRLLASISSDDEYLARLRSLGMTSYICVPLVARGRTLGAMSFVTTESGRRYGMAGLALAEEFARRAAIAVDNARLYEDEQRARRSAERAAERTARLQAITAALAETLSPEQVARVVVEEGVGAVGAQAGSVALTSADRRSVEIAHAAGYPPAVMASWSRFPLDAPSALADAIRGCQAILLGSAEELIARYPQLSQTVTATGNQAFAAIPFLVEGRAVGALGLSFAEPRTFDDDDVAFMLALDRQSAQALERTRLYEAERLARDAAEVARQRLAFLAEASATLASSLDYEATLRGVADLVVPNLADWCTVHVVAEDDSIAQLVVAHADPAKLAWARELQERYPTDPDVPSGLPQVLRTGQPELYPTIDDALLVAAARDEEHLAFLRALGMASVMIVPLVAHGQILGAISFVAAESGRHYGRDDLAFAEDLARRCAVAVANARLYREAQEAVRARDEFLSIAAHELRTPVTSVKGYAQMLQRAQARDSLGSDRAAQFLRAIDESSDRLRILADDLLDVSRLRLGQLPLRPQPLDLAALARLVVDRYQAQIGDRHRLTIAAPAAVAPVLADPDRTEQILTNLLDNAAKYSPDGGTIAVTVEPGDGGVLLTVRDEGIGLPAGELESIFEPFQRAANAAHANLPGMGLGLYICRSIAERHGGRIWAESGGEGRGTTMRLWLPTESPDGSRQSPEDEDDEPDRVPEFDPASAD